METKILRGSDTVHFGFNDGDYSNNIVIRNTTVQEAPDAKTLSIDISGNLRQLNKQSNSFEDATLFKENPSKFRCLQISHEKIVQRVRKQYENWPGGDWKLKIKFNSKHEVNYDVNCRFDDTDLWVENLDNTQ